jgi:hypothetical protein
MALAHVQTVKGVTSAGTVATTAGITTTSGNLLVCVAGAFQAGVSPVSVITDSNSNTWTNVANSSPQTPNASSRIYMYYAKNITGGASHTFTQTITGGVNFMTIFVMEISGAHLTSPLDAVAQAGNTGNSAAANSGTTPTRANANAILIGAFGSADGVNAGTITAGTGFTIPTNGSETNFNNYVSAIEYQIVTSVGTDAAAFTISSQLWGCIIGVFNDAGAVDPSIHSGRGQGRRLRTQALKRSYYW